MSDNTTGAGTTTGAGQATRAGQVNGPDPGVVGSEFAEIKVAVDRQGNGPRLRLEDLRTGRVRYLDALELETIIWLPDGHLRQLLDPSADRWREDTGQ